MALKPAVLESVLRRDPEVIIAGSDVADDPAETLQWLRWSDLAAVRGENLHAIPRELLVRHTPRLLDGAEQLCEILESVRKKQGME